MTLVSISSPGRLATVGLVAWLVAACAVPTSPPTPSPTAMPTIPPAAPAYTLGPTPGACPTAAPGAMTVGTTATVTMTTNFGTIVIKVDASLGAHAAGTFLALARCGYYNNVLFHRIPASPAVIQGGDGQYARLPSIEPDKYGQGGPGFTIPDDVVSASYTRGTVAMANAGSANTGGSQFFIVLTDTAFTQSTTPTYAIFGTVTQGLDVVDKIAAIPVGGDNGDSALQIAVITGTTVTTP